MANTKKSKRGRSSSYRKKSVRNSKKSKKHASVRAKKPLKSSAKELITKDMSLSEIMADHPETGEVFTQYGLHCVGCYIAPYETVEQGARGHGMDDETIAMMLRDANSVIGKTKKKSDSGKNPFEVKNPEDSESAASLNDRNVENPDNSLSAESELAEDTANEDAEKQAPEDAKSVSEEPVKKKKRWFWQR